MKLSLFKYQVSIIILCHLFVNMQSSLFYFNHLWRIAIEPSFVCESANNWNPKVMNGPQILHTGCEKDIQFSENQCLMLNLLPFFPSILQSGTEKTLGTQKTDQKTLDGFFQTVLYYRVMAVISTLIKYKSRSKIGLTDLQRNNLMVALEKDHVYYKYYVLLFLRLKYFYLVNHRYLMYK